MLSENDQDLANPNPDLESNAKTEFPEGLRVLAVDDNLVCLKLIVTLLVKCSFKVTATTKPTEALDMLRKNKESYDLVITDVEMLDMDGFQLLQIIGIEMDVPVIRRKARSPRLPGEAGPDRGAQEHLAACCEEKNCLSRPNRAPGKRQQIKTLCRRRDKGTRGRKRRRKRRVHRMGNLRPQRSIGLFGAKELHNKFVDALEQLERAAVPKKILEVMDVPGLSRENVASHLQKFKNLLKKDSQKSEMNLESEVLVANLLAITLGMEGEIEILRLLDHKSSSSITKKSTNKERSPHPNGRTIRYRGDASEV
ncbi:response regulator 10 [Actinidia rufa]|uniref:Response regulator 10 n=1 Tax=Actinidia rufa TaxID=165716 RepID=A0A7J0E2A5_9ERIC|nr:response regulator 10 [Actinidia rufa]